MTEHNTDVTIFEEMLNKTFSEVFQLTTPEEQKQLITRFGSYQDEYKDTLKYAFRHGMDSDTLIFVEADLSAIHVFTHVQDCCESVWIEDVTGDLSDLVAKPLLMAEVVTEMHKNVSEHDYEECWSFFKYATVKGSVTVRWIGTSNGYYSVEADYYCFKKA